MNSVYAIRIHPSRATWIRIIYREVGEEYQGINDYLEAICQDERGWCNTFTYEEVNGGLFLKIFPTEQEAKDDLTLNLKSEGYAVLNEERMSVLASKYNKLSHLE